MLLHGEIGSPFYPLLPVKAIYTSGFHRILSIMCTCGLVDVPRNSNACVRLADVSFVSEDSRLLA